VSGPASHTVITAHAAIRFPAGILARDRLEAVIRRGGRQGRRVAVLVKDLDDRYEKVTLPKYVFEPLLSWWHNREPIDGF
jgi:hypothetical protein